MYDVVVSTYTKSTEWTNKFPKSTYNVIKYTKNVLAPNSATNINVNKGNEASAFLKHIITNYDSLTEKTIFLHDEEYSWHHVGSIIQLVERNIKCTNFMNLNSFVMGTILNNEHFPEILSNYYKPYLEPYIGPHTQFGDWTMGSKGCAQYIVHKSHILNKPKLMYEDLLQWIITSKYGDTVNCKNIEAKFMEWIWDIIFLNPCYFDTIKFMRKLTSPINSATSSIYTIYNHVHYPPYKHVTFDQVRSKFVFVEKDNFLNNHIV